MRRPRARRDGDTVTLSNSLYRVKLDLSQGLSISGIRNRWSEASFTLAGRSGLEVASGDTVLTGRAFHTQSVAIEGDSATIVLAGLHDGFPWGPTSDLRRPCIPVVVAFSTMARLDGRAILGSWSGTPSSCFPLPSSPRLAA